MKCDNCNGVGETRCPDCEKREREAKERREREERAAKERRERKEREERNRRFEAQKKKEAAEKAAKERKDAAVGCGCLLTIAGVVAFLIWWWMEGFTTAALPGMCDQVKGAFDGWGKGLAAIAKILGVLAVLFVTWKVIKSKRTGDGTSTAKSIRKRWVFILLGLILGPFGVHLAYAKRWLLFLLLWAGFITGNVMRGDKPNQEGASTEIPAAEVVAQQSKPDDKSSKGGTNPISGAGFAVWALLWIGGTLFIKKDGKGNRM